MEGAKSLEEENEEKIVGLDVDENAMLLEGILKE